MKLPRSSCLASDSSGGRWKPNWQGDRNVALHKHKGLTRLQSSQQGGCLEQGFGIGVLGLGK